MYPSQNRNYRFANFPNFFNRKGKILSFEPAFQIMFVNHRFPFDHLVGLATLLAHDERLNSFNAFAFGGEIISLSIITKICVCFGDGFQTVSS